jgi:hypothetical protein
MRLLSDLKGGGFLISTPKNAKVIPAVLTSKFVE